MVKLQQVVISVQETATTYLQPNQLARHGQRIRWLRQTKRTRQQSSFLIFLFCSCN